MMHVMSAPPSAATAGTPTGGRAGRSGGDPDFASVLAAHSPPATGTQPEAVSGQAPTLPAAEGETSSELGGSVDEEASMLLAVVAAPPGTVEPAEGGVPARTPVETAEPGDGVVGASTTTLAGASTTTASATEITPSQASSPAPGTPVGGGTTSTEPDQAQPTAVAPVAPAEAGGHTGPTDVAPEAPDTARATHRIDGAARIEQPAASGTAMRVAPESAQAAAGSTTSPAEKVDGAARRPSTADRPGPRVASQGQADMTAAASTTSDVDGAASPASRPAEGSQPLPSTVLDRVMRAVEALENAPPPKRVSFEVDGLRLTVSLRGDEVNVAVRGGGDQLGAGWQRDLDGALRGRGLGLADGQGSDADRGDGRRNPDDRPPHPSAERGPAFRQPTEPDGDTSTNLHL